MAEGTERSRSPSCCRASARGLLSRDPGAAC